MCFLDTFTTFIGFPIKNYPSISTYGVRRGRSETLIVAGSRASRSFPSSAVNNKGELEHPTTLPIRTSELDRPKAAMCPPCHETCVRPDPVDLPTTSKEQRAGKAPTLTQITGSSNREGWPDPHTSNPPIPRLRRVKLHCGLWPQRTMWLISNDLCI